MSDHPTFSAQCLTPILYVRDFREATEYYTKKLFFDARWNWGKPPSFGCVALGNVEIFLCLKGQGRPGMWMTIFMDDVDAYFKTHPEGGSRSDLRSSRRTLGLPGNPCARSKPARHSLRPGHPGARTQVDD